MTESADEGRVLRSAAAVAADLFAPGCGYRFTLLATRLARGDIRLVELRFEEVGHGLQELSGCMSGGFGLQRLGSVCGAGITESPSIVR